MLTFTAIITTYKREWPLIERAIQSILSQTYEISEIILFDDNPPGSPYTEEIKEHLKDYPAVTYLSAGKNLGVAAARNFAVEHASGDVIGFLDDDDEWFPDKISTQIGLMGKEDVGLAFSKGVKVKEGTTQEELTWSSMMFLPEPSYKDMLYGDRVGTATNPIIRRNVFLELGGFLTKDQPAVEDYELWIRIAKHYRIRGVDAVLFRKHMPQGQHVSTNHSRTFIGYSNIYRMNKAEYDRFPAGKWKIMYNIARKGVMARTPKVIPYLFRWLFAKVKVMVMRKRI